MFRLLAGRPSTSSTVDKRFARVRPFEAGDDPQRRCLAAAARSEQGHELTGLDVEVDMVERDNRAERAAKSSELDGSHNDPSLVRDGDCGCATAASAE